MIIHIIGNEYNMPPNGLTKTSDVRKGQQASGGGLVGIELKAWIGVLKDKRKEKSESNSIEFKIYEAE